MNDLFLSYLRYLVTVGQHHAQFKFRIDHGQQVGYALLVSQGPVDGFRVEEHCFCSVGDRFEYISPSPDTS